MKSMKKQLIVPVVRVVCICTCNIIATSAAIDIQSKSVEEGEMYAPERHSIWE